MLIVLLVLSVRILVRHTYSQSPMYVYVRNYVVWLAAKLFPLTLGLVALVGLLLLHVGLRL